MLRSNVPGTVRVLRRRRGWRQADLGRKSGTSRETISRLERGDVRGLTLGTVETIANALGANVDVRLHWQGEDLDRLVDSAHAALTKSAAGRLDSLGWLVRIEVSFNHYGDRGRFDVLAFHPARRCIAVVEVKSGFGDLQDTLGRLDVKARLGRTIAREVGWIGDSVVPMLVVAESRTARRVVARHGPLFARYAVRGRGAVAWLRDPRSPIPSGLLWFVRSADSRQATVRRGQRVRLVTSGA